MSVLDEMPAAPTERQPWKSWALSRWIVYRDQQLEARSYALKHGQPTDIIDACIRLAEHHIEARTISTPIGDLQVVASHRDLAR